MLWAGNWHHLLFRRKEQEDIVVSVDDNDHTPKSLVIEVNVRPSKALGAYLMKLI